MQQQLLRPQQRVAGGGARLQLARAEKHRVRRQTTTPRATAGEGGSSGSMQLQFEAAAR